MPPAIEIMISVAAPMNNSEGESVAEREGVMSISLLNGLGVSVGFWKDEFSTTT